MIFVGLVIGRLPDAYDRQARPISHETLLDGTEARILDKGEYKPERAEAGHFTGRIVDLRI